MLGNIVRKTTNILSSQWFFYGVMAFLVFEALWIVASAAYPMAFDEDFHFGVISIYAQQWSPWLTEQPAGSEAFGALLRDPSYLYHYVMSFPLRIVQVFTDSQAVQVIVLRLLNIGMFAAGVVVARRLLLRLGTSPAAAHLAILIFALVPVVPLLAAHINYDNLVVLLVPSLLLCAIRFIERLKKGELDLVAGLLVLNLCLFGSVVKYAFLPIALVVALFCLYYVIREFAYGRGRKKKPSLVAAYQRSVAKISKPLLVGLTALFLIGFGLFTERYVVNTVHYGTPVPACEKVIGETRCSAYSPWQRNYILEHTKVSEPSTNSVDYTRQWLWGLFYRLFFMVGGPAVNFDTRNPLPVVYKTGIALAIGGALLVAVYARKLFRRNSSFALITLVFGFYAFVLWLSNYADYVATGQPVAVNGRYLIPLLLPMSALAITAFSAAFRRAKCAKTLVATAIVLLFLQGGGLASFIISSKPTWYWPNQTVHALNDNTRILLKSLIIEGRQ